MVQMVKKRLCVLLLGVACSTLMACASQPQVQLPDLAKRTGHHTLYVVNHGWHTGLILPSLPLVSRLPGLENGFDGLVIRIASAMRPGRTSWIEVGWGDKGFYQARHVTTGLALRAFFASSGAVLHLATSELGFREDRAMPGPEDYFAGSDMVALCVSDQELESVARFVASSFQRTSEGGLLPLGRGLYGDSQFYEAKGRYNVLHTCNTWTAKGLASAGLPIEPEGILTASGVMQAVRKAVVERGECAHLKEEAFELKEALIKNLSINTWSVRQGQGKAAFLPREWTLRSSTKAKRRFDADIGHEYVIYG